MVDLEMPVEGAATHEVSPAGKWIRQPRPLTVAYSVGRAHPRCAVNHGLNFPARKPVGVSETSCPDPAPGAAVSGAEFVKLARVGLHEANEVFGLE